MYNDVSVNENMHLATAFKILRRPGNDLVEHLSPEQYRFFRRTVIQIVLATDMAGHSELLQASCFHRLPLSVTTTCASHLPIECEPPFDLKCCADIPTAAGCSIALLGYVVMS